jgi:phage terminase small subunit
MTPKQQLFVREYLVDLNATQAAIRAGYSERTAGQMGFDLLRNPKLAAAVQAGMDKRAAKVELTAEEVLADIKRIAKKAEESADWGAALKGRELLGKHLRLFTEKVEHTGANGGPIQVVTGIDREAGK